MTNQEIVEEFFYKASDLCLFDEMHKMVKELMTDKPYMEFQQVVEIAFFELTKQYEISK